MTNSMIPAVDEALRDMKGQSDILLDAASELNDIMENFTPGAAIQLSYEQLDKIADLLNTTGLMIRHIM